MTEREGTTMDTRPCVGANTILSVLPEAVDRQGSSSRCPACFDEYQDDDLISCGCQHAFCRDCMQRLVREHQPLPKCPMASCGNFVREDIILTFLGTTGVEAYQSALLNHALQQMRNRFECPNPCCNSVVTLEDSVRHCWQCSCGSPPVCTKCNQLYHFHAECHEVQPLRERWLDWLCKGRERHAGLQAGYEEFAAERAAVLEVAAQRHKDLQEDERYKVEHCRLCPHCFRVVQKLDGCNSMRCGQNWHGGGTQQGCGKTFSWTEAPKYQASSLSHNLPDLDGSRALNGGSGCRHLFTRCAACTKMIKGPRFRCIHCESFDLCTTCEAAMVQHPADHVFEIMLTTNDPPIEHLPKGTLVSMFGCEGPPAMLNGCSAKVRRYSDASGLYELQLSSGSLVFVSKEHVQPEVEDPTDAQSLLEVALGRQEVATGFNLGCHEGTSVEVVSIVDENGFHPLARIRFYDPVTTRYGIEWEEAPQWACTRCTLLNDAQAARCAACNFTAPVAYAKPCVAVDAVRPLATSMDEVKSIAQRHWTETQRVEKLVIAAEIANECNLGIARGSLVQIIDTALIRDAQTGHAFVESYHEDGTYCVALRDDNDIKIRMRSLWVKAEQLRPALATEEDPLSCAHRMVHKHKSETQRLHRTAEANLRVKHCNLGIPPQSLVKWNKKLDDGYAKIESYCRDGTYIICLRALSGQSLVWSSTHHWVPAVQVEPIFYSSDDPSYDAEQTENRHQEEQKRLSIVAEAHERAISYVLGIPEQSFACYTGSEKPTTHNGSCLVESYGRDGSYIVCLRGSSGKFNEASLRRWVRAGELQPRFYNQDDPDEACALVKEKHEKEQERLQEVFEANELAKTCTTNFPSGTRVVPVDTSQKHCSFSLASRHKLVFISSWVEVVFTGQSLIGELRNVCELRTDSIVDGPETRHFDCEVGSLRPVFWDEASPMAAASRVISRDSSAWARYALSAVYRRCSQKGASPNYGIRQSGSNLPLSQFCSRGQLVLDGSATFSNMNLGTELLQNVCEYGLDEPSLLQRRCLPILLQGRDSMCVYHPELGVSEVELAITYVLPALQRVHFDQAVCQVLILVPSDECGQQVRKIVCALGKNLFSPSCRCGEAKAGGSYDDAPKPPEEDLARQVVVGTVKQIDRLLEEGSLKMTSLKMLILHDAGAIESPAGRPHLHLQNALKDLPRRVQRFAFLQARLLDCWNLLRRDLMSNALLLRMNHRALSLERCRQYYVAIEREEWKLDTLTDIVEILPDKPCLVFCNTRRKVDFLVEQLQRRDMRAAGMYQEMDRAERDVAFSRFRSRDVLLLIVTDLTSYCMLGDTSLCNVVVNFDLPRAADTYLDRVGHPETRYGRSHFAFNFVTNNDVRTLKEIEQYFHMRMEELPMDIADLVG